MALLHGVICLCFLDITREFSDIEFFLESGNLAPSTGTSLPEHNIPAIFMSDDSQHRQLFESCIDQNADSMYRVAYRLTGDRELASELVQETCLNAWRSIGSLKDASKMRGWVFAILRNQYTKVLRKLPAERQLAQPESVQSVGPTSEPDETTTQAIVQQAIEQLDDHHKFPILLVSMEGMSVDAASEVLDVPRGTVLSRLHRGRKQLKEIIERMKTGEPN